MGKLMAAALLSGWLICANVGAAAAEGEEKESPTGKKAAVALVTETKAMLTRGQDLLRTVSVKLPGLVTDNFKFKRIDQIVEDTRQELTPDLPLAERLKTSPENLKDLVRLYLSLRILQERAHLLSDNLVSLENPAARPLGLSVMSFSNRCGALSLKLHPITYKVIDAYQAAAPKDKVTINLQWFDVDEVQGPSI